MRSTLIGMGNTGGSFNMTGTLTNLSRPGTMGSRCGTRGSTRFASLRDSISRPGTTSAQNSNSSTIVDGGLYNSDKRSSFQRQGDACNHELPPLGKVKWGKDSADRFWIFAS